jgi:hypothetical protein
MKRCVRFSQTNSSDIKYISYKIIHDSVGKSYNKSSLHYSKPELLHIRRKLQMVCHDLQQEYSHNDYTSISTKMQEMLCQHCHRQILSEEILNSKNERNT